MLLLTVFALGGGDARASWFLDERKFHISAHGETSCLDCHDDIADLALHPDPSKVTGKRTDFF